MQSHVEGLDDDRQVLAVRDGVVVDVVVTLVGDTLGTIQRRVNPVQPDTVC